MNHADVVAYCLAKPGAVADGPWEGDQVAKVGGKIFAFLGSGGGVGLKCGRDADEAAELRLAYPDAVTKSAYIGRHGWNSITLDGTIPCRRAGRALIDLRRRRCPEGARRRRSGVDRVLRDGRGEAPEAIAPGLIVRDPAQFAHGDSPADHRGRP